MDLYGAGSRKIYSVKSKKPLVVTKKDIGVRIYESRPVKARKGHEPNEWNLFVKENYHLFKDLEPTKRFKALSEYRTFNKKVKKE